MEGGGRGRIIYLSPHCHHQNDSCIKMGSDKSHFNVSLIVRDKVTRQCPQTENLFEAKGNPKQNRAEALVFILTPNRNTQMRKKDLPFILPPPGSFVLF